jgi:hypothetical protein
VFIQIVEGNSGGGMSIDSNKNINNQNNKLSLKDRFKAGSASAGLSVLATAPEIGTGLALAGLYSKGKDIFIKSERKMLPVVKKVMFKNPSLVLLLGMGIGLSAFLEYSSYKLMNKAVTGKKTDKDSEDKVDKKEK